MACILNKVETRASFEDMKEPDASTMNSEILINVAARIVEGYPPPPSTKIVGLNSVEPGAPLGGWLRIWVPLIKLEGNCGGRGVWGLAQDLSSYL